MKTKDQYIESLASELKEWSAQIDLMAAKAENATADAKLNYAREIEELRAKQREASAKMKELEEASGDAWETVKETADNVWDDLKTGIARAVSKFR
jgi:chromosome segregation ATPase